MGKNKSRRKDVVIQQIHFVYEYDSQITETLPANQQKLYVSVDRKMRHENQLP